MASQFISDAMKDSFEINCPVKLNNSLTRVPWWIKALAKIRVEVRRLFNRARNSSEEGDWERFRETQRAYKKAIVIAKRNSWREFCEGIEKVPEAVRLHRILSQENKIYLGCIKFPSGDYTESMEESLEHLMHVYFPDSRGPSDGSGGRPMLGRGYKPREWRLAAKVVYPSGVEWLLRPSNPTMYQVQPGFIPFYYRRDSNT